MKAGEKHFCEAQLDAKAGEGHFCGAMRRESRQGAFLCGERRDAATGEGRARCNENVWLNDSHSLFNGSFGKGKAKDKFGY